MKESARRFPIQPPVTTATFSIGGAVTTATFSIARLVKCPVCLGRGDVADGMHRIHKCRTCAGNGRIVTEHSSR